MQGATFRLAALESSAAELPFGGERGAEWILTKSTFQGTFNTGGAKKKLLNHLRLQTYKNPVKGI